MRLVYLTLEYLQPIFSGNGALARMQIDELIQQHHSILVFCANALNQQELEPDTTLRTVIAIPIRSQKTLGPDADFPTLNREMIQYFARIQRFQPDAVIVVDWHFMDSAMALKKTLQIPLIYQVFRIFSRDPAYLPDPHQFELIRKIEQDMAHISDENIHLSKDTAEWARKNFKVPTRILFPPLKPSFIEQANKLSVSSYKPIQMPLKLVTFVRISPEKEIDRMIKCLKDITIPWTLNILGEAVNKPYYDQLQSLIKQYCLQERIIFDGRLELETLLKQISNADAYIHPARYEPFGISIMEAAYLGLPILLDQSDQIGAGELLIDGQSCLRLDFDSPKATNLKLQQTIQDSEKWLQIGQNARNVASTLNVEKNVHQLVDWINEHK